MPYLVSLCVFQIFIVPLKSCTEVVIFGKFETIKSGFLSIEHHSIVISPLTYRIDGVCGLGIVRLEIVIKITDIILISNEDKPMMSRLIISSIDLSSMYIYFD